MVKQIVRVLDAVKEGGETSDQIAAMTGIGLHAVSSYLTELTKDGLVRRIKWDELRMPERRGRLMHVYRPAA